MTSVTLGLERLDEPWVREILENRRLGLLLNQASVDCELKLAAEVVLQRFPGQLKALFSPQHGIWGEQQANMIETDHGVYSPLQLPVYSLYSETRRPSAAMLESIDCLIVDLQDVGTRVYTFIWTMLEVLRACEAAGKRVVILDRPNPIGGEVFEGPILEGDYLSFVGSWPIPMRHGLTMGELARLFAAESNLQVDLHVIPMIGWNRRMHFAECQRHWIWPSPNMPTLTTTLVYPGQVLLEGVNLSEGRGTTRPFEVVGAPFVDAYRWIDELAAFELQGVRLLPTRFKPTFDKWKDESCQGIDIRVTDALQLRSFALTVALVATAAKLFPEFCWLDPPYEYEFIKPPIDILFGSDQLRRRVSQYKLGDCDADGMMHVVSCDTTSWQQRTANYLMYS